MFPQGWCGNKRSFLKRLFMNFCDSYQENMDFLPTIYSLISLRHSVTYGRRGISLTCDNLEVLSHMIRPFNSIVFEKSECSKGSTFGKWAVVSMLVAKEYVVIVS